MKPSLENCRQPREVLDFLIGFSTRPRGFVLLAGPSGNGKTYAAQATINACPGFTRFVNVTDLYVRWLDAQRLGESVLNLVAPLFDVDILVIDDLGIRTPTESFLDYLYLLINKRLEHRGGTIITTNMTSAEMEKRLGNAVMSRICSGQIFKFEGEDRRLSASF